MVVIDAPWQLEAQHVCRALGVDRARGLAETEARVRRARYGPNALPERRPASAWRVLGNQVASLIVALLAAAALVSFLFRDWAEGVAILCVLVANTALGFVAEWRALRSMDALRRLGTIATRVRRDGVVREVPAEALVPGDVVLVDGGDVVTADLRLLHGSRIQADESLLTGESVPVEKDPAPTAAGAAIHERASMLFRGTAVTRGAGEGVVVATGEATELGRIARLAREAHAERTPLEQRLAALGHRLIRFTLGVAVMTAVIGVASGRDVFLMIELGLALAVAAIPEGLPIVATIALGRGMWRMAARHVLVNRLAAVETLGATTVVFTDKTGTLTENQLTLERVALHGGDVRLADGSADDGPLREALVAGVLCNGATLGDGGGAGATGDPLEVALLEAGARQGLDRAELLARWPEVAQEAFDPGHRLMATVHRDGDALRFAVKGAAEAVLAASVAVRTAAGDVPLDDDARRRWRGRDEALAAEGLRVIAVATKAATAPEPAYAGLVLLGLLGLQDPPRREVRDAVARCRQAGVRVVMVTGDQAATARSVARAVGLADVEGEPVVEGRALQADAADGGRDLLRTQIFARVSPEQKLDLITLHQRAGEVVAMTGDGVNDAPALRKADIGVAMGRRGTQVAREAADMVLKDDAFESIVAAIQEGRVIFGNIRRFVIYLLSCNVSEVLVVFAAAMLRAPLPLLPLQILFLNLVTDVFPALALAFGEGDASVMDRPPRPSGEPIVTGAQWRWILGRGLLLAGCVMSASLAAREVVGLDADAALTCSFLTLACAQLLHVFSMRGAAASPWRNDVTRNPWVWGALGLCGTLLVAALLVEPVAAVLRLAPLGAAGWGLVGAFSLLPWALGLLLGCVPGEGAAPRD